MTDNEIIKALDKCASIGESCEGCPFYEYTDCDTRLKECFHDLIKRKDAEIEELYKSLDKRILENEAQKAEIERLQKLQKPTATSGFKIENGKVIFYTNILNGYRHEYKDLKEIVDEMNLMLQNAYKNQDISGFYTGKLKEKQAEIERLETIKKYIDIVIHEGCEYPTAESYNKAFQKALARLYDNTKAKSEAYKEFAERLKEEISHIPVWGRVAEKKIDNLVKEMTVKGGGADA